MEENKDKREDAEGIDEDTLIFRREPQTKPQVPQNGQRVSENMQHTAQIQGGAVIRPLKKQPTQIPPQNPAPGQALQQRPTGQIPPRNAQGQVPQQRPTPTITPLVRTPSSQQADRRNDTGRAMVQQGQGTPSNTSGITPKSSTAAAKSSTTAGTGASADAASQKSRQPSAPVQQTQHGAQIIVPAQKIQPKKRTENDDFEIDEATYTRDIKKPKRDSAFVDSATSAIMSLVKAVVYIVALIAVSVALAVFAINTGNDVFKFVVEDKLVTVNIPEYATIDDVADALYDAGAIKYKWAFKLWSELKDSGAEFIPGTYEISTTLNYDYLRAAFKEKTTNTEVRLTIPEGYTVDEIIDLFVENGIGTREGFVDVIQNYEFDYQFLENLVVSPDRIYRLEGYLFPDTYYFYQDSTEATVIKKLLDNFDRKFADDYYARCDDLGITVDQAIILASMIEKETRYADELGYVSSVFHNRLKYSASFPYLNSDATIMYAMQHDLGGRPDSMTGEDTTYDTPYNTYTNKGLPPGPIANPGLNSIKYALYPNDTKYFYFVSDSSGRTLFAETQQEHEANIIKARGN